jgi:hydrogenase maturation protein HypF
MKALALHVTGIVQGVGFRPFVYNLAIEQGLLGWVLNASDGVHVLVEGPAETVDAFPQAIRDRAPAMAVIEDIVAEEVEPEHFSAFQIRASHAEEGAMTLVSPDIATCPECVAELLTQDDRRFRYPFINCTNCGPRFTIIGDVPYDRPMTSMRDFPMCPECAEEYGDPGDRRFHAQPDACYVCGPRLYLNPAVRAGGPGGGAPLRQSSAGARATSEDQRSSSAASPPAELAAHPLPAPQPARFSYEPDFLWAPECDVSPRVHRDRDAERVRSDAIIAAAAGLLLDGRVLAIKGLGGFHLACDATNADAVRTLRERKHRWGKPLAVMVRDVEAARALCDVGPEEQALLEGVVRPIVLLRKRERRATSAAVTPDTLAPGVADELTEIGVMLPYTPLHHLLLAEVSRPLVMTSGNLSDEPIATDNAEALARLGSIADAFLLHDRAILSRYDDSVVRVVDGRTELVRRSRGYAPFPLSLPFETDVDILAAGPEQKNTFTLLTGGYAFVSQHIGDMENAETLASFEATEKLYERLFRIEPEVVAYDLHPEYLSSKWALGLDLPKVGVQHHHAHIVSVTAEHGISERAVGVAFDGTGYGEDGRIWGGEVLLADWEGYERFAHLAYVPMPGGSGAIKRPARMAVGTLSALGLLDHPGADSLRARLAPGEEQTLLRMIERGVNCPLTSSMGRLFDSVAAIAGITDDARYEGEAAILLEAAADLSADGAYRFGIREHAPGEPGEDEVEDWCGLGEDSARLPLVIDPAPALTALLDDIAGGEGSGVVSARFHRGVVECIVGVCELASRHVGSRHVALAGGVFMNRIVFGEAVRRLESAGLAPLTHVKLPVNDGAVSFGQAVVAWARRHRI